MKKDVTTKTCLRDNRYFADIVNGGFFEGRQVIHPENLSEIDSALSAMLDLSADFKEYLNKGHDVSKPYKHELAIIIISQEPQAKIHYAMPERSMVYDVVSYEKQMQDIAKKHREAKDLKDAAE